ncbi:hypothetical protein RJI07_07885 [Mycoplasmatota bacterium WC30]
MESLNYETLFQEVHILLGDKKYEEAYNLLTNNQDIEGGVLPRIYYYRFCLAALIGRKELGLKIIREAVVDNGFWYPDNFYLDTDLDILRNDGEFDKLLKISKKNELEALDKSELRIKTVLPSKEYLKHPKLILFIHGKGPNLSYKQFLSIYDPIYHVDSLKEYILAIPLSSISSYAGCPDWVDISKGIAEIKTHLDNLVKQYKIRNEDITMISFSYGATLLLEGYKKGVFNLSNIAFLEPYIERVEEKLEDIEIFKEKDMSIYVFCGDQDNLCIPTATALSKKLSILNVRSEYKIEKGIGHEYPSDISVMFQKVIDFFEIKN